jgi:hypothetical protein
VIRRKLPPRREATQCTYTPRPRTPAASCARHDGKDRMVVPVPKAEPVRDDDYRRLVATLKCISCGAVGHSQAAHPNTGKGMGLKADDRECFPLCTVGAKDCHGGFDQRAMFDKQTRRELEPLWANQTRATLRSLAMFDNRVRIIVERVIGLD